MHRQRLAARLAPMALCALAISGLPGAALALQGANDVQIEASKQLLSEDRYIEALAGAKDALRVDPAGYRASNYCAMASTGLQQYDTARTQPHLAPARA
ncbi:MAG: hypothetical protein IBJ05_11350, partial [Blastomonas sp.]|nr:hypothetical protein [Blastomonas sp.]